ncbi:hypothetical protein FHS16_003966 [Paenibacillus endophyticus]|uniref:Uncharacterized protein n=1 Tax=Paenibacillus endophyticus TaxID=1294268 RepID=A0A7W5CA05_9BACL|nr:hypothetical protein [Paenibacillus endophyticus]
MFFHLTFFEILKVFQPIFIGQRSLSPTDTLTHWYNSISLFTLQEYDFSFCTVNKNNILIIFRNYSYLKFFMI